MSNAARAARLGLLTAVIGPLRLAFCLGQPPLVSGCEAITFISPLASTLPPLGWQQPRSRQSPGSFISGRAPPHRIVDVVLRIAASCVLMLGAGYCLFAAMIKAFFVG